LSAEKETRATKIDAKMNHPSGADRSIRKKRASPKAGIKNRMKKDL